MPAARTLGGLGRGQKVLVGSTRAAAQGGSPWPGPSSPRSRFATGTTFDEYARYAGSSDNLAREAFGGYFPDGGSMRRPAQGQQRGLPRALRAGRASTDHQIAAIKWLVAQPGGPAKILVISEDWSSDCRRDVPMLARLAEAGGLELRIFNRDGQTDPGHAAARSRRRARTPTTTSCSSS